MTRAELVRMFVLNACCDDYEDIEQITKQVNELCPKCGLNVSHEDILQALRELMELKYVRAWNLTQQAPKPSRDYEGMPSREEIAALDPYFKTRENLAFTELLSSDLFDDTGILIAKWTEREASMTRGGFVRSFVLNSVHCHYLNIGLLEKRRDVFAKRTRISISRIGRASIRESSQSCRAGRTARVRFYAAA
jgi:hypothetical protein